MPAPVNITGERYGRLLVLNRAPNRMRPSESRFGRTAWNTRCDCGALKVATTHELRKGRTRSCGCLKFETTSATGESNRTHGRTQTTEYRCWISMINRCENPDSEQYRYWVGAGVRVCERWRLSFVDFLADVGHRPSPKHSLDRYPNKTGDYEPGNVRWATDQQQQRNRTDNIMVEAFGENLSIHEWGDRFGVKPDTISHRLCRGWDPTRAVSEPPHARH